MDKCDNCTEEAVYLNRPSDDSIQFFCVKHVPWFLTDRIATGNLERANQVTEDVAPKSTKKRKADVPVEQSDTENTDQAGAPDPADNPEDGSVSA